jgi:hypothetical protein
MYMYKLGLQHSFSFFSDNFLHVLLGVSCSTVGRKKTANSKLHDTKSSQYFQIYGI